MKVLTKEQQNSYETEKTYCICPEKSEKNYLKDKKYRKVRDHFYYTGEYSGAEHTTWNLKYSLTKKNHIVFHNRSNYDYHFIIN